MLLKTRCRPFPVRASLNCVAFGSSNCCAGDCFMGVPHDKKPLSKENVRGHRGDVAVPYWDWGTRFVAASDGIFLMLFKFVQAFASIGFVRSYRGFLWLSLHSAVSILRAQLRDFLAVCTRCRAASPGGNLSAAVSRRPSWSDATAETSASAVRNTVTLALFTSASGNGNNFYIWKDCQSRLPEALSYKC